MSHAALPELRTPRLTLRPLEMTDADAIVEGVGNFDVSKWLAVVPYPYGRADARWFLNRVREERRKVWAICNAHGLIGVGGIEDELGYWLARPAWGKGYGFEAAHAIVAHWFSDPEAGTLLSHVFDGNDRSAAILTALGFRPVERVERDARALSQRVTALRVSLTRADWERRQDFTLYTPRLTIRPLTLDDAPAFKALTVREVARNLGRVKPDMTLDEARADMPRRIWRGYPGFTLAVEQGDRMIGWVGFGGLPLSVGYALAPDAWGQGLMTEALSAVMPELFMRFPVNRIVADHFEDNPTSGVVLRKLGFDVTGEDVSTSQARLEPCRVITYAVTRDSLKVPV
ncbi:GNAT family N-acetyltransferase [Alphaproteobacteria bacterium GH1-50]|uniref:GNAT family N-acetyltransferase n=1 Tax=Kangsaoukella pontilimi TaxID=2691042 RepID=A0A7C9MVQ1_9RHOB|nr:GNAT family N-acetyltransferase [Kangsaoukella pontilimi]MXQ07820.1 GNAT family N-acetyltransferase [Kangsaoukella pontilimi]